MKKFRFLYIAAAALLFAACANEEDGIGNNGPVAATVKADISNNIKTRGTADNDKWTTGDAIGVYVTSAGNTKGTNVKYEYDSMVNLFRQILFILEITRNRHSVRIIHTLMTPIMTNSMKMVG